MVEQYMREIGNRQLKSHNSKDMQKTTTTEKVSRASLKVILLTDFLLRQGNYSLLFCKRQKNGLKTATVK